MSASRLHIAPAASTSKLQGAPKELCLNLGSNNPHTVACKAAAPVAVQWTRGAAVRPC